MVSIALLIPGTPAELMALMSLPMIIGGVCIITSIIGTYFVKLGSSQSIMGALYKGFWTTAVLSIPAIYGAMIWGLGNLDAPVPGGGFTGLARFWCAMVGLAEIERAWWRERV